MFCNFAPTVMKKILFVLLIAGIGFASCNKETPQPLTKAEIKQKIDSITAIRIRQSDDMARIDLERRMKIEVKVKVDSIVNAELQPGTKDTVKANAKAQVPNPNITDPKATMPGLIPAANAQVRPK